MSEIQNQIKKWPVTAIKKIKSTFGSAEKFYATVYLIARNEHHCQMMGVAGAEQRLKTIHAYQGMIRFMLDEEGLNGKEILETIAGEYRISRMYRPYASRASCLLSGTGISAFHR